MHHQITQKIRTISPSYHYTNKTKSTGKNWRICFEILITSVLGLHFTLRVALVVLRNFEIKKVDKNLKSELNHLSQAYLLQR